MDKAKLTHFLNHLPLVSIGVGGGALIVFLLPALNPLLELVRGSFYAGEWWRLFTAHFTHWSFDHLLWDTLTFFVLCALYETASLNPQRKEFFVSRTHLLTTIGISSLAISSSVLLFLPQLTLYRGLSGLCVTLFVMLALSYWLEAKKARDRTSARLALLALILLLGKVLYEGFSGRAFFVEMPSEEYVVVPLAHLVGGIVGAIGVFAAKLNSRIGDCAICTQPDTCQQRNATPPLNILKNAVPKQLAFRERCCSRSCQ